MTGRDTARRDIRRRQREIADRVIAADRGHGADRAKINAALAAAGLPILDDEAEAAFEMTILGAG